MTEARPFQLNVPNDALNRILKRVVEFPWDSMKNLNGWEYGTNFTYMKELCAYWINEFDW